MLTPQDNLENTDISDTAVKKELQITGREIIQDYSELKPASVVKYQELLKALNLFDTWSDFSRCDFIEQFLDLYDILDAKFQEIVYQFCKLPWHKIPASIRPRFVNFLSLLAIHHVYYINAVFNSFVYQFIPSLDQKASLSDDSFISDKNTTITSENYNMAIDKAAQEEIYEMAHKSIQMVIDCNQLSSRILIKCCVKQFPHNRQSTPILLGYVRNLIHITEYTSDEELALELWSLIIDRLLQLDASISNYHDEESRLSICKSEAIKDLDSELEDREKLNEVKLDQLIAFILMYIGQKHLNQLDPSVANRLHVEPKTRNDFSIFNILLEAFDEHVLSTIGVHSIPFIWFYICSISTENCSRMLEFLWGVLRSPIDSPNEWKKTHNAAAFLCGFLARANYVDFNLSCIWLRKISIWCEEYIDKYSSQSNENKNIHAGGFQHGTFYATVQALLFIFCYRYEEIRKIADLSEIHAWNLEKIVYNCLDPLFYISQGVALCFLNLNRKFKLINSNNNLISELTTRTQTVFKLKRKKGAVELFFPFSFCSLKLSSPYILPLMRRFSTSNDKFESNEGQKTKRTDHLPESNNFLYEDADEEMPIDEGYEDELMCVQSVSDFSRYLMMAAEEKREQHDMEC